ncbi:MAG: helix-turn-helix domain-containing protein [Candidatus Marinimicrobia bacterium]|nr:helix-turn-helix domain-containing protein [Candidatus Neomarinimicrobiota bacterium]MCF7841116.1 helix-turn-helix domain-containing protein [Candidatus Neomarinimicrobiota bacterium]MCF7901794.1 helix-turn-helix domain-containing protein [Candidatus Neomarinimicrobiota bacterium]
MNENEEILDLDTACELLRIRHRTMYTLLKEGKVPGVKIGGQWRFSKKALLDMFNTNNPISPVSGEEQQEDTGTPPHE